MPRTTGILEKHLGAVVGSTGEIEHRYVLDGILPELYGDYTKTSSPKAVIKARFFLLDDSQPETRLVFQKTYRKEAGLVDQTPEVFAAGLGTAFREILTELTADLERAQLMLGAKPAGREGTSTSPKRK